MDDNPDGGWFGLEYSFKESSCPRFWDQFLHQPRWWCGLELWAVGGLGFDRTVFFVNDSDGWVGGGEISPNVEGWLHRTTDGGNTWSGRVLNTPWPIREIFFLTPEIGWAAGGNLYTDVGGIYFTFDGGQTWSLDVNTGHEMDACDGGHIGKKAQIWCAGYDGSFSAQIYTLQGTLP